MCCHGGPMQLDEYRKEVSDIYNIYQTIFEKSQDDEVYEAILEFRDDEDLIGWGIWNKVFKSFDSVKQYILRERIFMDDDDEEPMVNRAYWKVTKYKLNKGEYKEFMICCFSIDMQLLSVDFGLYIRVFFQDNKTYDEILNHNYLLLNPKNIELPYQTGDILKINAMPFGKDFYVVYGGEARKGDFEKGIVEKFDYFYHWCIYESKDRNGLWIDDISNFFFTDYVHFENCPLICCEQVESCPDDKITKVSRMLKENPELWYELVSYEETIQSRESNLSKLIMMEVCQEMYDKGYDFTVHNISNAIKEFIIENGKIAPVLRDIF